MAEVCGIHAGDGYLRMRRGKGEIDISGHLEEKKYYDMHVVPSFNSVFSLNLKAREFSKGTYGFVIYNKKIAESFSQLGFPVGKKSLSVKIPLQILESKNFILYARFLRDLFDTDGHIGFRKSYGKYILFKIKKHHYPIIHITTISKLLMEDICFMLNELEIKHFVYCYSPKKFHENAYYRVIISRRNRIDEWMRMIGSKNFVKFSRFLIWNKFGFCPTNTSLKKEKIF